MLKVTPLGGLGEVGMNTLVLEHGAERVLIDCGLMFPRGDLPGVEIIVPDFGALLDAPDSLKGVVLTHAHEDHLGALPWLLRELKVPVWGTPFTLALARHRLEEAGVEAELRELGPREEFRVGEQFRVEPVRVTHSVPDSVGLIIRTATGTLVHSGDFKLDLFPVDGQLTDLERLGEVGDEGVLALLSDSTNAEVPGSTGSERVVQDTFERLVSTAKGRVVIAVFGSHLHRVRHAVDLAQRLGRRVVLVGRSLQRNVELAQEVGLLEAWRDVLAGADAVGQVSRERLLVLCTGAQAEPRSALMGMLSAEPGPLRIEAGDLVILSSRTIPGNEPLVTALINRLLARGARVVYPAIEPGVHVSGHAAQDEQRRLLEVVRPRHFVPIHGELRHLHSHLQLARQQGLPAERTFLMTDGDVVGFARDSATTLGRVPVGTRAMRRESVAPINPEALGERRALAESGVVVVVAVLQTGGGRVVSGPTVHARGLPTAETAALGLATEGAALALSELSEAIRGDDERVREALVRGVRRVFKQLFGTRPAVMPVVLRVQA
ncbi:MAG: ribonuclease J [Myxococcaceae bacterium]